MHSSWIEREPSGTGESLGLSFFFDMLAKIPVMQSPESDDPKVPKQLSGKIGGYTITATCVKNQLGKRMAPELAKLRV